ncbi:MAG TPA: FHA domain-containing protein [Myxococcota bacterium]|jgi:pSer/pThr/pTyr-binding forkhead associated (FHA) protein
MKDGRTRKLEKHDKGGKAGFLATHSAAIVFASGPLGGTEVPLEKDRVTIGRGVGVDIVLSDASVSNQHAALELAGAGFRIRDLGSTNGVRVNGGRVAASDLKHGDRLEIGSISFRYRVESRKTSTPTHHLDDEE